MKPLSHVRRRRSQPSTDNPHSRDCGFDQSPLPAAEGCTQNTYPVTKAYQTHEYSHNNSKIKQKQVSQLSHYLYSLTYRNHLPLFQHQTNSQKFLQIKINVVTLRSDINRIIY